MSDQPFNLPNQADLDGDGTADAAYSDFIDVDGDGYGETTLGDEDLDGNVDIAYLDTDFDGVDDTAVVDVDFDGTLDEVWLDLDGDFIFDTAISLDGGDVTPFETDFSTSATSETFVIDDFTMEWDDASVFEWDFMDPSYGEYYTDYSAYGEYDSTNWTSSTPESDDIIPVDSGLTFDTSFADTSFSDTGVDAFSTFDASQVPFDTVVNNSLVDSSYDSSFGTSMDSSFDSTFETSDYSMISDYSSDTSVYGDGGAEMMSQAYSMADSMSTDLWNQSVDAYANGDDLSSYDLNSQSLTWNSLSDSAWDTWSAAESDPSSATWSDAYETADDMSWELWNQSVDAYVQGDDMLSYDLEQQSYAWDSAADSAWDASADYSSYGSGTSDTGYSMISDTSYE